MRSMLEKSKNAQKKLMQGTSQYTLLKNRINALEIALSLMQKEISNNDIKYSVLEIDKAIVPIKSLLSKSEKVKIKLKENTWQYKMLENNLDALYIAILLMENVKKVTTDNTEFKYNKNKNISDKS